MKTTRTTQPTIRLYAAAAAVALSVMGLAGAARAQDPVELRVVDRNTGQVLHTWTHDGRLYVAGQPGARYSLRVVNHTDGRVLVVMSVDGVNILTGETAGYDQRGYIFGPHESYDVSGWRKSNTEVAAFTFAPLPQSYAARTGRPADVGVIGMAVFNERVAVPLPEADASANRRYGGGSRDRITEAPEQLPPPPLARAAPAPPSSAAPADQALAGETARGYAGIAPPAPRDDRLGTGHGAREWSVVNIVSFERATPYPQFVRQIEYDTYANLVASGVIPPPQYDEHRPRPFPTAPDGEGYVPDPPD